MTNVISDTCYPDRDTFRRLVENLNAERFTLVVHMNDEAQGRRLALVAPNVEKGLAAPEGLHEIKSGGKVVGWTAPFAYGEKTPFFLLEQATVDRLSREWSQFRRKVRSDAAKLDNRDQFVAEKLAKELDGEIKRYHGCTVVEPLTVTENARDDGTLSERLI